VTKRFIVNFKRDPPNFPHERTALTNSPPNYDLFHMLSSMINLESVELDYTSITAIPSHAFQPVNGIQNNLTYVDFLFSLIEEIGNNSFYHLNNLKYLSFYWNNLRSISKTAFNFKSNSNEKMELNLKYNNLNSTSFEIGSLIYLKRPTEINLAQNPSLTYFEQDIFQHFLDSNIENKLLIQDSHIISSYFNCDDCRSYWLRNNYKYSNRTDLTLCSNRKNYTDNSNFAKCAQLF
jgi:hypothetical protein